MSPLDYLRAMARRQKLAAGGFVPYEPDKQLQIGGRYLGPTNRPAPAAYEGLTVRMRGYTEPAPRNSASSSTRSAPSWGGSGRSPGRPAASAPHGLQLGSGTAQHLRLWSSWAAPVGSFTAAATTP